MAFIVKFSFCIISLSLLLQLFLLPANELTAQVYADTASLPTIVIDAGHGGFDGGAVAVDGTLEKDINLSIALNLKNMFRLGGYNVVMIRETDDSIEDNVNDSIAKRKLSDMKKRLEMLNSYDNSMFISIHQNKFTTSSANGAQVFYSINNQESKTIAESIQNSFSTRLQKNNKRIIKKGNKNIYLLHNALNPAVIVECGFISNSEELAKLKTEEYRKMCAFTVYCGVLDYFAML